MPRLVTALRVAHDASPPLCHALYLAADAPKTTLTIALTHIVVGTAASTKAPGLPRHITRSTHPTSTRTFVSSVTASSPPRLGAQLAYIEPAQIKPNGVQVYHCVRSHQCIAYCPLLTVCSLCYNWRPHCWAAAAVQHCAWLFVALLPGYDHHHCAPLAFKIAADTA